LSSSAYSSQFGWKVASLATGALRAASIFAGGTAAYLRRRAS
jgi:hypothetical protein